MGPNTSETIKGGGPLAVKTKEAAKFGEWELRKVESGRWYARIQGDKKNGTATDLNISINRHDGRIEFWQGNKYEIIGGEATSTSARLFFTPKGKLDEIEHFDMGMKLPKVQVLEENIQNFLKSKEVQKALAEVNEEIEKRERTKEFNRQAKEHEKIHGRFSKPLK